MATSDVPPNKGVKWNPEVNLGHILTVLSMVGVIMTLWVNIDKRVTVIETKQQSIERSNEILTQNIRVLTDNQSSMARAIDRMTYIIEQREKERTHQ